MSDEVIKENSKSEKSEGKEKESEGYDLEDLLKLFGEGDPI